MASRVRDVDLVKCAGPRRLVRMRTSSGETQTCFPERQPGPAVAGSKQWTGTAGKLCSGLLRPGRRIRRPTMTAMSCRPRRAEAVRRTAIVAVLWAAACTGRPPAQGLPGSIEVYAQGPGGPFQLRPRQMVGLRRPQKLAFRWVPAGDGPRIIRIRAIFDHGPEQVLHEARVGPEAHYLDWLLELDERGPSRFRLQTEVVSPHDQPIRTRYGIQVRDGPD